MTHTGHKIGFIGQGYIGKNMADDYEERGYEVVRYSLEDEFLVNKNNIATCDIVFIAVPTPTNAQGSDHSIVTDSVGLVGDGAIAVIKSTILPGSARLIQDVYPKKTVLFSPEFLSKNTAVHDAKNPMCNVIGVMDTEDATLAKIAALVHQTLPKSPKVFTVSAEAAEHFKYIHNVHGFIRIVASNLFYDMAEKVGAQWDELQPMIDADPMMSPYYNQPIHKSGRGAGGCCFIKDFAAFRMMYEQLRPEDTLGIELLQVLEKKNLALLQETGKDTDIVAEIYPG